MAITELRGARTLKGLLDGGVKRLAGTGGDPVVQLHPVPPNTWCGR